MILNNYYSIALNDYKYFKDTCNTTYYNQIAAQAQQVCEKLFKYVIERYIFEPTNPEILRTHNLAHLCREIRKVFPDINISVEKCSYITDFYFDTRYPGTDFINVDKEDAQNCIEFVELVKNEVDKILKDKNDEFYLLEMKNLASF